MQAIIYNSKYWVAETDPETLKTKLPLLLDQSGYEIVGFSEHYFKPYGYTAVWLLSESHLAVHTFPEENKSYIELSGCNEAFDIRFKKLISSYLALTESTSLV